MLFPFLKVRVDNQSNIEADQKSSHAALLKPKKSPAHDLRDHMPNVAEHRWTFSEVVAMSGCMKKHATAKRRLIDGGPVCDVSNGDPCTTG
jgi:hypothetical protein